jgi:hypothetical protein
MYRIGKYFLISTFCILCTSSCSQAEGNSKEGRSNHPDPAFVRTTYLSAGSHPDKFDAYAATLRNRADEFNSCKSAVQINLTKTWKNMYDYCRTLPPEEQSECTSADFLRLSEDLDALYQVIQGKAKFQDTRMGQLSMASLNLAGPEQHQAIFLSVMTVYLPLMNCP